MCWPTCASGASTWPSWSTNFPAPTGIITIEDLVEEIVGEIEDEHDEAPIEQVVAIDEGVWDADASVELDDVAKVVGDPALAEVEEAVDTLGGLAFVLAEEVPQPGTILTHPSGWRIEVTAGDETHVTRLRLHAPPRKQQIRRELNPSLSHCSIFCAVRQKLFGYGQFGLDRDRF